MLDSLTVLRLVLTLPLIYRLRSTEVAGSKVSSAQIVNLGRGYWLLLIWHALVEKRDLVPVGKGL
jgi:hypothetical protein